jgi:hypothetical protein
VPQYVIPNPNALRVEITPDDDGNIDLTIDGLPVAYLSKYGVLHLVEVHPAHRDELVRKNIQMNGDFIACQTD